MNELVDLESISIDTMAKMVSVHKSTARRMLKKTHPDGTPMFRHTRIGADDGSMRILKVDVIAYIKGKFGIEEASHDSHN